MLGAQVLELKLLGTFVLARDGEVLAGISTPRLQALVACLALHRGIPQLRQQVAYQFWPDSNDAQARNNLRQLVHELRSALPAYDAYLSIDRQSLCWRRDAPLRLDVEEFEHACDAIEQAERQRDVAALREAGERILEWYQADLLPACYDDWITPERERLHARFSQTLDRLVRALAASGDSTAAIRYARRAVRDNRLDEQVHRSLMRLLALNGDRAGELTAYQACVSSLQRELGIGPSQATEDLHQQLLHATLQRAASVEAPGDRSGMPNARAANAPALVGRQREWETLRGAWQAATRTGPGLVLVAGEAGIGKSRLAEELVSWVSCTGATAATTRAYAVEGSMPLAPVTEWLRSPAVRPHVASLEPVWLTEVARLLPELEAEHPNLPARKPLSEYSQRQHFFQALARAVLAAPPPLLLVIDDLQWCDLDTLEWLHFLLRFDPGAHLLVVGTARTEEAPPDHPLQSLLQHARRSMPVTELALQPLDAAETAALARHLLARDLAIDAIMRLFGETEGNPLFVIETVRAGMEHLGTPDSALDHDGAAAPLAPRPIPSGVRSVIASRLAQLSAPAREMAELAALVGREFDLDILAHVSHGDEERTVRALDELWRRRIVRERGPGVYDFTHDKLREVAQAEISAPQRHLWHRRIAQSLEDLHAGYLDPVSGQIAMHFEHGGAPERAIPYYQRAAAVAQRMFAHEDAIQLLRHCLALLEHLAEGAARDRQELNILLALAPLYRITRGWTAPDVERVVDRTLALCDTVADDTQRAEALYGLQSLLVVQARLERVELVAGELRTLFERRQGAVPTLSTMMLAGARLHMGRFTEAEAAFARILAAQDQQHVQYLEESQGWNFAVHARAWHAHAMWCLGYPERAMRSAHEAVQLALSFEQRFNQSLAAAYLAMLSTLSEADDARARAEEALAFAVEFKAPYYRSWAAILVAAADARECPDLERVKALRAAIEEFKLSGARLRLPCYLSLLARAAAQAGDPEQGLACVEEALSESRNSNERWWDAELHRLRGELLLAAGRNALDAESALVHAANVAHDQQARWLELRALTACCAHLTNAGVDLWGRLGELTGWFSEGFDTSELRSARALLARHTSGLHIEGGSTSRRASGE